MEQFYPRIEAYLNQKMTAEEKAAFEQECEQENSGLALALAYYLSVHKAAEEVRRSELRARYNQLPVHQKKPVSNTRWLAVAACLVLLAAAFLFWPVGASHTPASLADQYWEQSEIPEPINQMGENEAVEKELKTAFEAYQSRNYEAALKILTNIPVEHPLGAASLRLQGIIHFEQGKTGQAIQIFQTYLDDNKGTKAEVLWFQALAFLKNDEKEKALVNLEEIIQKKYSLSDKAKALKNEIEQLKN